MALITCKDCKKEFSTDARRCPNCGARPPKKLLSGGRFVFWTFAILFGLSILGHGNQPQPEFNAKLSCKYYVKKQLHDPSSAEFDDPNSYPLTIDKQGYYLVKVSVRARNAFNALRHTVFLCKTNKHGDYYEIKELS